MKNIKEGMRDERSDVESTGVKNLNKHYVMVTRLAAGAAERRRRKKEKKLQSRLPNTVNCKVHYVHFKKDTPWKNNYDRKLVH